MSTLEAEIEKKTKEFDAIKKDRQLLQQSTSSETPSQTENPSIEIVRNFRPGFHNSPQDGQSLSVSRVPPSATLEPQLAATSSFPASMDATAQTPWSGEASETIGNTAQRSSEIPYANLAADVLDVVDENAAKEERQSSLDSAITIALFSSAKKDTDFSSAWKQLTAYLPIAPQPRVILDFQNVIFLYDRELQYLEKIRDVILAQGGSLQFVNCHDELRSILSRRPTLAGCIA